MRAYKDLKESNLYNIYLTFEKLEGVLEQTFLVVDTLANMLLREFNEGISDREVHNIKFEKFDVYKELKIPNKSKIVYKVTIQIKDN